MRAGELRHRVAIQTNTPSQDAYGQPVESWATTATVWAAVEMLDGRELFAAQQAQSEATVRFTIRYRSGLTAQQRVSWDGRVFGIEAIIHDPTNNRMTQLLAKEVQN